MRSTTLLRLYPRAWRERYADEVLALIEQSGGGWRCSASLLIGAAREWARAAVTQSMLGTTGRLVLRCAWELLLASLVAPIVAVAMSFIPYSPIPWALVDGRAVAFDLAGTLVMAAVVISYCTLCSLPIASAARRHDGWKRHAMFVIAIAVMLVISRSITSWIPALLGSSWLLWRVAYRTNVVGPMRVRKVAA